MLLNFAGQDTGVFFKADTASAILDVTSFLVFAINGVLVCIVGNAARLLWKNATSVKDHETKVTALIREAGTGIALARDGASAERQRSGNDRVPQSAGDDNSRGGSAPSTVN